MAKARLGAGFVLNLDFEKNAERPDGCSFQTLGMGGRAEGARGVYVKLEYFTGPHLMKTSQSFALVVNSFNSQ